MANNTPADNITVATMTVKGITRYSGEPYNGVVNANVIFKPYSALGDIWVDSLQVPVVIQSVEGIIQNGVLKDKTGNTGVKLYASTPEGDSNIAHNQWTAIFLDVTVDGIPALMNEIVFDAKSNEYVDLVDYVPVPLKNDAGLIRGPRGTIIDSFTIEGSELIVWERAKDGSLVKIDSVDISHFATESARIASEEALANLEQTLINHKESSSREAGRARDEADRATQQANESGESANKSEESAGKSDQSAKKSREYSENSAKSEDASRAYSVVAVAAADRAMEAMRRTSPEN